MTKLVKITVEIEETRVAEFLRQTFSAPKGVDVEYKAKTKDDPRLTNGTPRDVGMYKGQWTKSLTNTSLNEYSVTRLFRENIRYLGQLVKLTEVEVAALGPRHTGANRLFMEDVRGMLEAEGVTLGWVPKHKHVGTQYKRMGQRGKRSEPRSGPTGATPVRGNRAHD